ncbi:uncharacterized protein [Linepithema humile]|uniref:uncharacterized protein n=1 Tax=Linepithema humile TaxID=83485 RepID=UPI00351ECF14
MAVPTIKFKRIEQVQKQKRAHKITMLSKKLITETYVPQVMEVNTINMDKEPSTSNEMLQSVLQANNLPNTSSKEKNKSSWSYYPEPDDTSRKSHIKRKIMGMATNEKLLRKQITQLQKVTYQQKRRIENLTSVVQKLQKNFFY